MVTPIAVVKRSARLFVHPRCVDGPASGAFEAMLEERGYDVLKLRLHCGPTSRGYHELVRVVEETPERFKFERMDGTQFDFEKEKPTIPGAA